MTGLVRASGPVVIDFEQLTFPEHLHYLVDEDTWARVEDDGSVTVGITSLGVALSGDLYMCRPRPIGAMVEQRRGIAVVELAKSIVSMKSPVSGEVIAINEVLAQQPERANHDPYGDGWIARLRPLHWEAERAALVTGAAVAPAMRHRAWLMCRADAPDGAQGDASP
ncbi:MAG: hypothetical protein IT390_02135 [Nitrospira sp.]|nr:hypothetical protein [Nitrospira sp.]